METIKVVLADDHAIVRDGIKQLLETEEYIQIVGEASSGKEAIECVEEHQPDILIMDISMPEMTGIEATDELIKRKSETKVLILSMYDKEEYVLKAVKLGAFGYLMKDTSKDKFVKAIKTVQNGQKYFSSEISNIIVNEYLSNMQTGGTAKKSKSLLTKREAEILSLVTKGYNNKKIADSFDLSIRTVETHRLNIMKKLNVNNAAEMVRVALERELV